MFWSLGVRVLGIRFSGAHGVSLIWETTKTGFRRLKTMGPKYGPLNPGSLSTWHLPSRHPLDGQGLMLHPYIPRTLNPEPLAAFST